MASLVKKIIAGRPYYYLVWNARVGGKPRRIRQVYLGSAEQVAARLTDQVEAVPAPDGSYSICREFGASAALWRMSEKIGLIQLIDEHVPNRKKGLSVGQYLVLAAINRCVAPTGKSTMADWYGGTCLSTVLPATAKTLRGQRFWDAMSELGDEEIRRIEADIARKVQRLFEVDVQHVLYDATNFFTFIKTQTPSELAQRGHNKAHRDDLKQVSLALLVSMDFGIPIFHHCYPGNVIDSKEFDAVLTPMEQRTKQLEPAAKVTIVFDKGNNSEANFKRLDQKDCPFHYVGSLPPSQHEDLITVPFSSFTSLRGFKGTIAYRSTKKVFGKERTVVVTWNPRLAAGQEAALHTYLKKAMAALKDIEERLQRLPSRTPAQQKRTTIATVQREINEVLKRKEVRQCIEAQVHDETGLPVLTFQTNTKGLAELKTRVHGKNLIVTDQADWSTERIVRAYRSQYKLEHQFKNMKNPRALCWWPRFHWTDQKIRVHAFYCVLGLLLLSLQQRELAREGLDIPIPRMLKELRAIQETTQVIIHRPSDDALAGLTTATTTLTKLNPEQDRMFRILQLWQFAAGVLGTTKRPRRKPLPAMV